MSPAPAGPLLRAEARGRSGTTPVGTLDAGELARVDEAGVVQVRGRTWVLDWWVGAEDRWHHPSLEAAVRQEAVDSSPVRSTALRVPGGDIVQRVAGVVASVAGSTGPAVAVEFENRSAVPVALALVVRPLTLPGGASGPDRSSGRIVAAGVAGSVVRVDGHVAALLDRPATRAAAARCRPDVPGGTVAERLADSDDVVPPVSFEDRDGLAELAVVVPLTHTATVRVLLPTGTLCSPTDGGDPSTWDAPTIDSAVAGWALHRGSAPTVEVGEPGWAAGVSWAGAVLSVAGPDEVGACLDSARPGGGDPSWTAAGRAAAVCAAMARLGAADELVPVARGLATAQRLGGSCRLGDRTDGSVALLWAAAAVLAGPMADGHSDELVAPVAVAIRRLRRGKGLEGVDAVTAAAALRAVAPGLLAAGQPEVAADAVTVAGRVAADAVTVAGRVAADAVTVAGRVAADAVTVVPDVDVPALSSAWDAAGDRLVDGDVAELARRVLGVLDVAAVDTADGVVVLTRVPASGLGVPMDVRGVRTAWGRLSWSLRWHGERPALLWEIESAVGLGAEPVPTVRAPGLDESFVGAGWSGEELLAPRAPLNPGDAVSFS